MGGRLKLFGASVAATCAIAGIAASGGAAAPLTCGANGCSVSAFGGSLSLTRAPDGANGTVTELCARYGVGASNCNLLAGYFDSNPVSSGLGGGPLSQEVGVSLYPGPPEELVLYFGHPGQPFTPVACFDVTALRPC
jgi:hypothetical protein